MTYEDLASKIVLGGLKAADLQATGFALRDGHTFADIRAAVSKGMMQGRGKLEHELWEVSRQLGKVLVAPLNAGDRCKCRRSVPWDLFESAGAEFSHNCPCGRTWAWHSPKSARYVTRS